MKGDLSPRWVRMWAKQNIPLFLMATVSLNQLCFSAKGLQVSSHPLCCW